MDNKTYNSKDDIQKELEGYCKTQVWCRKHLSKPIEFVEKINPYSISSARQKLKLI